MMQFNVAHTLSLTGKFLRWVPLHWLQKLCSSVESRPKLYINSFNDNGLTLGGTRQVTFFALRT